MARWPRFWAPGCGLHFISRFVDRRHRLVDDADRAAYLRCMGFAQDRWDWRWLSYALMSSHVHHGVIAGIQPPERMFRSLHTRVAQRYHRRTATLGPVFADRPKSYEVRSNALLRMVAYHHRNPVDAGVVGTPRDSTWTSHRAYLRLDPAPAWLDVEWALGALGFQDTAGGRREFDEFVGEIDLNEYRAGLERQPDDDNMTAALVRAQIPPPLQDPEWARLISVTADVTGLAPIDVLRSRNHQAAGARRYVATIAREDFGQSYASIGVRLNMATASVHNLIHRGPSGGTQEFAGRRARILARFVG